MGIVSNIIKRVVEDSVFYNRNRVNKEEKNLAQGKNIPHAYDNALAQYGKVEAQSNNSVSASDKDAGEKLSKAAKILGQQNENVKNIDAQKNQPDELGSFLNKYEIKDSNLKGSYALISDVNKPTLVLYPGNNRLAAELFAEHYSQYFDGKTNQPKLNLVVVNYYGKERSTEERLKYKVNSVLSYLDAKGIKAENQYASGQSLGCALATYHAHTLEQKGSQQIGGLIVDSPFVSEQQAVSEFLTTKFPVLAKIPGVKTLSNVIGRSIGKSIGNSWNNKELLAGISAPVTVLTPTSDDMISKTQHDGYYNAVSSQVERIEYSGLHATAGAELFIETVDKTVAKKKKEEEVKAQSERKLIAELCEEYGVSQQQFMTFLQDNWESYLENNQVLYTDMHQCLKGFMHSQLEEHIIGTWSKKNSSVSTEDQQIGVKALLDAIDHSSIQKDKFSIAEEAVDTLATPKLFEQQVKKHNCKTVSDVANAVVKEIAENRLIEDIDILMLDLAPEGTKNNKEWAKNITQRRNTQQQLGSSNGIV